MAEQMTIRLNAPGMTSLHKVGLAGLYMTLEALEQNRTKIDELSWALYSDRVVLHWQGENPKKALEQLIKHSFKIDNEGFFRLMGLEMDRPPTVDQKYLLYLALTNTFLQFGPHRSTGGKNTLRYEVDEKVCLIKDFAPISSYRHQQAAGVFLDKRGRFLPEIEVAGWLYPGGGQRHVAHADSKFTERPAQALCLLFAPVGCIFFQLVSRTKGRKARGALLIPAVHDLTEYVRLRQAIAEQGVLELTASGASDAVLRFITLVRAEREAKG
jgi:CRISPR-associated protein Cas8a1/Csx13